jgi:hypothetical protein
MSTSAGSVDADAEDLALPDEAAHCVAADAGDPGTLAIGVEPRSPSPVRDPLASQHDIGPRGRRG